MEGGAAMIKTATFYLAELPQDDKHLLEALCRDLGKAGSAMVREWYRAADEFTGEKITPRDWAAIQTQGTQVGKALVAKLGYRPELANDLGRAEFFARFKTEFKKILKGEKASIPFPGNAPFVYLRMDAGSAQATIAREGDDWLLLNPRFYPGGGRNKANLDRAWRLKGVDRKGWGYQILEKAEKWACIRLMPDRKKRGKWVAKVTAHLPDAPSAKGIAKEATWAGIDLGLNHPAVLSIPDHKDGGYVRFFGEQDYKRLWARLHEYEERKRRLNRAGKKRAARDLGAKITGLRQHVNELISRTVIDTCTGMRVTGIRMENLKGLGNEGKGKLKFWPRYHLVTRMEQKAKEAGLAFELVNPYATSRTCSVCGCEDKNNRNGSAFCCLRCGFKRHADVNAANNIARGMKNFDLAAGCKHGVGDVRRLELVG